MVDRIRAEFFGGYVHCASCDALLVMDHRSWWFGAMILGVEGWLGAALIVLLAARYLGWWSLPLLIGAFVSAGVLVAVFSPLQTADPAPSSIPRTPD